jgi:hypothetical protein
MGTKASANRLRLSLRTMHNTDGKLREMEDYPGVVPVLIDALEKKGMRFHEESFNNGDISYHNKYVVVFRGTAAEVLHRAFHGVPSGLTTHEPAHDAGLVVNGLGRPVGSVDFRPFEMSKATHKRSLPNAKAVYPPCPDADKPQNSKETSSGMVRMKKRKWPKWNLVQSKRGIRPKIKARVRALLLIAV